MRQILFVLLLCFSPLAQAENFKGNLRLFAGGLSFKPEEVNAVAQPLGFEELTKAGIVGLEATYSPWGPLSVGIRWDLRSVRVKETVSTSTDAANPYFADVKSTAVSFVARVDVIRTGIFFFDIFGAAGMADNRLDIRSSSGEGTYSKSSMITMAGASVGAGWKGISIYLEGGQQNCSSSELTRTGVTTAAIDKIKLDGQFITAGVLINGVPFSKGK